jgi:putative SOS response-associated peptidase YedK
MCGRYVSVQADSDLLAEFEALDARDDVEAKTGYNVAPTDAVRAIVNRRQRDGDGHAVGDPVRQLRVVNWGLVPSWSKDRSGAARMINARSESVASKPAFKRAFATRRCLIPADGWYEWQAARDAGAKAKAKAPKQAFFMTPTDGHGLAFAGLYEFWSDPSAPDVPTLTTATIITVASAGELEAIHDRMPLVLSAADWARWLDPAVKDPTDLLATWDEAAGEHLELRPVSSQVNSVRNDGPELIERVEAVAAVGADAADVPALF